MATKVGLKGDYATHSGRRGGATGINAPVLCNMHWGFSSVARRPLEAQSASAVLSCYVMNSGTSGSCASNVPLLGPRVRPPLAHEKGKRCRALGS